MPNSKSPNPDQQAADLAAYSLRASGFLLDLLIVDDAGVRISAHRPTQRGRFLERKSFSELED